MHVSAMGVFLILKLTQIVSLPVHIQYYSITYSAYWQCMRCWQTLGEIDLQVHVLGNKGVNVGRVYLGILSCVSPESILYSRKYWRD